MIRFFVGGTPKSMKVSGVAPFMRNGKQHYAPKRGNDEWVALVGKIGREAWGDRPPMQGGLAFIATFWMARPQSLKKTERLPLRRPDLDNLLHKMTDSFNGVLWLDDSQIVDLIARKRFTLDGRTGVEICVEPVYLAEGIGPMSPSPTHQPDLTASP